jgi:hypothetical protein
MRKKKREKDNIRYKLYKNKKIIGQEHHDRSHSSVGDDEIYYYQHHAYIVVDGK